MQETGVQTIAWEAEGWRLWGVQEILKEYRRIFRSSGVAGVQTIAWETEGRRLLEFRRFLRSSGVFLGVQELQEYRSSDNSLGDGGALC